jgi:hypothetical protein
MVININTAMYDLITLRPQKKVPWMNLLNISLEMLAFPYGSLVIVITRMLALITFTSDKTQVLKCS